MKFKSRIRTIRPGDFVNPAMRVTVLLEQGGTVDLVLFPTGAVSWGKMTGHESNFGNLALVEK